MFKRGLLISIVGGVFYICLVLLWAREYSILQVQAKEIVFQVNDNGLIESIESMEQSDKEVLSDSIENIVALNDDDEVYNFQEDQAYNQDMETESISQEDETMNNDDQFRIMIVFCFGLCAGVVVGHFLTGFIK